MRSRNVVTRVAAACRAKPAGKVWAFARLGVAGLRKRFGCIPPRDLVCGHLTSAERAQKLGRARLAATPRPRAAPEPSRWSAFVRLSKVVWKANSGPEGGVGHRLTAHQPDRHHTGPHVELVVGVAVHRWTGTHLRGGLVER
jgi:hypothetical protein